MIEKIKKYTSKFFPNVSRNIYYRINVFKYRGDKYFCPICENNFDRFLTGPDKSRQNSKCPGCGSLERQRLLWLYLKNKIQIEKLNIRLLNIAPDYAIQSKLRKLKNINYTSIDLNSDLAIEKQDLTKLNITDNSYDAILCYHVLEHIIDDKKAMKELYRILKPGGWAIIQSPFEKNLEKTFEDFSITSPEDRKKVFGQNDHVRIYGLDYIDRLRNAGFKVILDDFNRELNVKETNKYLLDKDEEIYFCEKPQALKN
jgi:predicted SAM-dependent methyltransferase